MSNTAYFIVNDTFSFPLTSTTSTLNVTLPFNSTSLTYRVITPDEIEIKYGITLQYGTTTTNIISGISYPMNPIYSPNSSSSATLYIGFEFGPFLINIFFNIQGSTTLDKVNNVLAIDYNYAGIEMNALDVENNPTTFFINTPQNGFSITDLKSSLGLFSSNNVGLIMQNLATTLEVVSTATVSLIPQTLSLDYSTGMIGSIIDVNNSSSLNYTLALSNLGMAVGQSVTICLINPGSTYADSIKIDGVDQSASIFTSDNTTSPSSTCNANIQSITIIIIHKNTNNYRLIVNLLSLVQNPSVFRETAVAPGGAGGPVPLAPEEPETEAPAPVLAG